MATHNVAQEMTALGYVLPGPHDSHLAVAVVWRDGEDGREYLVIEYNSGEGIQIKFPAGTNNDQPGECPLETLHRELPEETGLTASGEVKCIWVGTRTRNRGGKPGYHQKLAFMCEESQCQGTLRTTWMNDGGDKLSPPFWRTAAELFQSPSDGGLFVTHRPILEAAERHR